MRVVLVAGEDRRRQASSTNPTATPRCRRWRSVNKHTSMAKPVFDILASSQWRFDRTFENAKMPGLTAKGCARFCLLSPDTLRFSEQGTLSNGGTFTKRYLFRLEQERIHIRHDDPHTQGASFQTLQPVHDGPGEWACDARNYCAPDTYISQWSFTQTAWRTHHDVSGPHKNYRIITNFVRVDSLDGSHDA